MRRTTREDYELRIIRVQMHVQRHLDSPLSLDELARIACFSPFHFHRIFRAMVGESVQGYVRRLRLERAAFTLMSTNQRVLQVALDAGYETHEAFTRAFRRRFECSPTECRKGGLKNIPPGDVFVATIKKEEGKSEMEVSIQEFEAMSVATVRHTGPYAECKGAWETLCANPKVCQTFGPDSRFIGISYDDPEVTDSDKLRYDACVTIRENEDFGGGVVVQTIAAGRYAVTVHKGSYDGLHGCYQRLYREWLPKSGYEPECAPPLEIYLTDPEKTPPDEQLTEIRIPLK